MRRVKKRPNLKESEKRFQKIMSAALRREQAELAMAAQRKKAAKEAEAAAKEERLAQIRAKAGMAVTSGFVQSLQSSNDAFLAKLNAAEARDELDQGKHRAAVVKTANDLARVLG